jgi:hypothetical protein
LPTFNGSGVITGYTIPRPNVGDLLSDGTYNMVFNNYGSVTFSVAPTATFTVSGGVITGTTPGTGGSSNATASTGAGIRSALITWTGQRRMSNWMPSAWRSNAGTSMGGNITFQDCTVDLCNTGFKPISTAGCTLTIDNVSMDRIYQDYMAFSGMNPVIIRDCFGTRPFSNADAGDPHSDFIQLIHNGSGDWSGVVLERNIFATGNARGNMQGLFVADATTGYYVNPRIVGNVILTQGSINGLAVERPKDGFVFANLIVRFDPTSPRNTSTLASSLSSSDGDILFGSNIVESGTGYDAVVSDGGYPSVGLGLNGATVPYGDVFADHTATRLTKAQIVAAYTPKVAYSGRGPFGNTSYINHVNRTTNLDLEPTYCRFAALQSQSTSTVVTGDWSRIQGGPATGSISVAGGEYRFADDAAGANATAWTSTAGTYTRDKFVQPRHTTSGTGTTDTTTTLTFRSTYTATFVSTTASVLSFSLVDNGGVQYSNFSVGSLSGETGIRKVVIALRFKPDAVNSAANIFASTGAIAQRFWFPSTSAFRYQFQGTTRSLRPNITPTTNAQTHIITLDFTQADDTGCYWATLEDGVILNNTPGSGGSFTTSGGTASFSANGTGQMFVNDGAIGLFAESDGGGGIFDGAFSYFYMHWGDAGFTLPDITQSSVRNLFTADLIGANGEGPTGTTPKFYYTGNAAAWNAGIANLGSLTARPLNKATGGSYT